MKERIGKIFIIITLILALVIVNFVVVGQNLVMAIYEELESQGNSTNVSNVEFDTYFMTDGVKVHSKEQQIVNEESLLLQLNVKNAGSLSNAKIKIENANFTLKSEGVVNSYIKNINVDIGEIELNTITYNDNILIEIPIRFLKQEKFDLDYFEKEAQITLTGIYQNEQNQDVLANKKVRMIWRQETDIVLSQSIEKYMSLGEEGVLLQQNVTTQVPNNVLPREEEIINVQVPDLSSNAPKSIMILKNGQKISEENYEYKQDLKTIEIKEDKGVDTENKTTWEVGENKYKIIYMYPQEVGESIQQINLNTRLQSKLYTKEVTNKEDIQNVKIQKTGNIVSATRETKDEMYKGYLYANVNNEAIFTEKNVIEVSNINVESLNIETSTENFLNEQGQKFDISNQITYKNTVISKEEKDRILGLQGEIIIKNQNDEIVSTINEDTQEDENGNIVISYNENVTKLKISTTKPVQEGEIEFINQRGLKGNTVYTKEQLKTFNKLQTQIIVNVQEVATSEMNLLDTKTEAKIEINKDKLTTQEVNQNVQIIMTLKSDDIQYDTYKNPYLELQLPSQAENIEISSINKLYADEMNISTAKYNDSTKVLIIMLEGEQTAYRNKIEEGLKLAVNCNMTFSKKLPSTIGEIKLKVNNDGKETEIKANINIDSKYGVMVYRGISNNSNKFETVSETENLKAYVEDGEENNVNYAIVNNYENSINNVALIGSINNDETLKGEKAQSTFLMNLNEKIATNNENAKVYYSEEKNPSRDSDLWSEDIENLDNINSFKIELENTELKSGEILDINYLIKIEENLSDTNSSYQKLNIYYDYNSQNNEKILVNNYIVNASVVENILNSSLGETNKGIATTILATSSNEEVKEGEELLEGQTIKYTVKITNNTGNDLTNFILNGTQVDEEGNSNVTFYDYIESRVDAPTETGYLDITNYVENPELAQMQKKLDSFKNGETLTLTYEFSINEKKTANEITIGNIKISAENLEEQIIKTTSNPVKDAEIKLNMYYAKNEEEKLFQGGLGLFELNITNLSEDTISGLDTKIKIPDGIAIEEGDFTQFDPNMVVKNISEEYVTLEILDNIEKGKTLKKIIKFRVENFDTELLEKTYDFSYEITKNNQTYKSNNVIKSIVQNKINMNITQKGSIEGNVVRAGDILVYTTTIENTSERSKEITISDELPEECEHILSKLTSNGERVGTVTYSEESNSLQIDYEIKPKEKIILETSTVIDTSETNESEMTNVVIVKGEDQLEDSNEVTYLISIDDGEDNGNDSGNGDNGDDESDGVNRSISGTAWVDENENGQRDDDDNVLEGMIVFLLNNNTGEIEKQTTTDSQGIYRFDNLANQNYIIVFNYNNKKYKITEYQKENVSDAYNSDILDSKINGENVGVTDTIAVNDNSYKNIDAGFVVRKKFDFSLNKSITQTVIESGKTTKVNQFNKTKLAKIEINSKNVGNTIVNIEYEIDITNEGEVAGYCSNIIDYKPVDLNFNKSENKGWDIDASGRLSNESLKNQLINPGETVTVSLILTKNMNTENTGVTINTAEIGSQNSDENYSDIDSIAGNKVEGEDDISSAEIIISIGTGAGTVISIISIIAIIGVLITMSALIITRKGDK